MKYTELGNILRYAFNRKEPKALAKPLYKSEDMRTFLNVIAIDDDYNYKRILTSYYTLMFIIYTWVPRGGFK